MDARVHQLARLVDIVETLRGPGGCPWDREQTLGDMPKNLLEEACEVIDAIDDGARQPTASVREELGDLLMNIFLAAQICQDQGAFSLEEVTADICDKLIRRHPHVFGDAKADDVAQVLERWNAIKAAERQAKTGEARRESRLDRVPRSLPPLERADSLGRAAAKAGFDWPSASGALEKVREELDEVSAELNGNSPGAARLEEELGDVLFAVASLCRKLEISPDRALRKTLKKFTERFRYIEEKLPSLESASLEAMETLWQEAKLPAANDARSEN
jgi:tetrapyrrole methylase family protein/MazG family protein